jgi:hypothetical protein
VAELLRGAGDGGEVIVRKKCNGGGKSSRRNARFRIMMWVVGGRIIALIRG